MHHVMKTYVEEEAQPYELLTSALDRSGKLHAAVTLLPEEEPPVPTR